MALLIASPWLADALVGTIAASHVHATLDGVPHHRVALVLGTARRGPSGGINRYYRRRLIAARDLLRAGKVETILVSGDNARRGYDEPTAMRRDLIRMGVPADRIVRDFAGFRTLDSVLRAQHVFGLDGFVVVSQRFHCERAVFIARHHGLDASCFAARDVRGRAARRIRMRERLARLRAVLDVWVLGTEPRFLGRPEPIPRR